MRTAAIGPDPEIPPALIASRKCAEGRFGDDSGAAAPAPPAVPAEGDAFLDAPASPPPSTMAAVTVDASSRRVTNPRLNLLVHLAEDLRDAIVGGDIEAARIAHEAIGRLLGSAATQLAAADVVVRDQLHVGGRR